MVTPEMLLFLARRVGLWVPGVVDGRVEYAEPVLPGIFVYEPHLDDAQFGRLVVWAAMNNVRFGIECSESPADVWYINPARKYFNEYLSIDHNSTPDSIRAAAVVAICRALGWEDRE